MTRLCQGSVLCVLTTVWCFSVDDVALMWKILDLLGPSLSPNSKETILGRIVHLHISVSCTIQHPRGYGSTLCLRDEFEVYLGSVPFIIYSAFEI